MKRIITLLTLFICSTIAFGQEQPDSTKKDVEQKLSDTTKTDKNLYKRPEVILNFPETVQIKDVSEKPENLPSNMPWIAAIIIGVLSAIINFWIAARIKKSNDDNISLQLKSNEETFRLQMKSNEETIRLQMANAKSLALSEFKATLGTKNRQDWIGELRHSLSEFMAASSMMRAETYAAGVTVENIHPHFQKMQYNKGKIAMMLNRDKPEQKDVIDLVYAIVSMGFLNEAGFEENESLRLQAALTAKSSDLFKIHWKKIKSGFSDSAE